MAQNYGYCKINMYNAIPWIKGSTDVIGFDSLADQDAYFDYPTYQTSPETEHDGHPAYWENSVINNCQYIRETGEILLPIPVDAARYFNYIRITYLSPASTQIGIKRYGFVDSASYVSDNVTLITWTLDVFQTFQQWIGISGIVWNRRSASTDNPGDNTLPEEIEQLATRYNFKPLYYSHNFETPCVKIVSTASYEGTPGLNAYLVHAGGGSYGGIYSGCFELTFATPDAVNTWISAMNDLGGLEGSIVSISMSPNFTRNTGSFTDYYTMAAMPIYQDSAHTTLETTINSNNLHTFDGYVPKNKKLYTYPYLKMIGTNYEGGELDYRYEYFASTIGAITFGLALSYNGTFDGAIVPQAYRGLNNDWGSRLNYPHLPQCAYSYDAFSAKIASQLATYNGYAQLIGGAAQGVRNALTNSTTSTSTKTKTTNSTSITGKSATSNVSDHFKNIASGNTTVGSNINAGSLGAAMNQVSGTASSNIGKVVTDALGSASDVSSALTNAGNKILGAVSDIAGAVSDSLSAAQSTLMSAVDVSALPYASNGSPQPDIFWSHGIRKPDLFRASIIREQARIIDEYYSGFGYKDSTAENNVRPFICSNHRQVFDYVSVTSVSSVRCTWLSGNEIQAIIDILKNGLRIWHFCQYNYTNYPGSMTYLLGHYTYFNNPISSLRA